MQFVGNSLANNLNDLFFKGFDVDIKIQFRLIELKWIVKSVIVRYLGYIVDSLVQNSFYYFDFRADFLRQLTIVSIFDLYASLIRVSWNLEMAWPNRVYYCVLLIQSLSFWYQYYSHSNEAIVKNYLSPSSASFKVASSIILELSN